MRYLRKTTHTSTLQHYINTTMHTSNDNTTSQPTTLLSQTATQPQKDYAYLQTTMHTSKPSKRLRIPQNDINTTSQTGYTTSQPATLSQKYYTTSNPKKGTTRPQSDNMITKRLCILQMTTSPHTRLLALPYKRLHYLRKIHYILR